MDKAVARRGCHGCGRRVLARVEGDGVGRREAAPGLDVRAEDLAPGAVLLPFSQGRTLDVLHGDVDTVAVGAGVVDADDVVVREECDGLGLAQEAAALAIRALVGGVDQLDGVAALEVAVPAEVDLGHRAAADPAQDDVLADLRACLDGAEQPRVNAVDDQPVLERVREGLFHGEHVHGEGPGERGCHAVNVSSRGVFDQAVRAGLRGGTSAPGSASSA